ncbi:hypothetical protein Pen01_31510 [Phytomonospora endophytica]|nr:hypothetical protein Pen01_31510 [Phytomonospora endophytica]
MSAGGASLVDRFDHLLLTWADLAARDSAHGRVQQFHDFRFGTDHDATLPAGSDNPPGAPPPRNAFGPNGQ